MIQDTTLSFGGRLTSSLSDVFGHLLPSLLGALIMLFAGYLLAKVLERLVSQALKQIRLNQMLARGGVIEAVERSGTHINPSRVLAALVFWLVMFAVILVASTALGMESLGAMLNELVRYIPSVIAAVVIILVGIVLGRFVGGLISASAGALHGGRALARVGSGGGVLLGIFIAVPGVGIVAGIVGTAFPVPFRASAPAVAPASRA